MHSVALQIQVTVKFDQNIGGSIWTLLNRILVEFVGKSDSISMITNQLIASLTGKRECIIYLICEQESYSF